MKPEVLVVVSSVLISVTFCVSAGAQEDIQQLKGFLNKGQFKDFIGLVETKGLDVLSLRDDKRQSLLHWISEIPSEFREGQPELWQKFLTAPKNINSADLNGNTPLHLAVRAGNVRYASWLLFNDARVNVKNKNGSTPLHLAVEAGLRKTINDLLENDRQLTRLLFEPDLKGRTALHIAVENDFFHIVETLCEQDESAQEKYIHNKPFGNPSAFQLAISLKRIKILDYFIRHTEDVNNLQNRNLEGSTVLQASLQFPSTAITKLLLQKFGNDVVQLYYEDLFGHNILHYAAKFGNNDVFAAVLRLTPAADKVRYLTAKSSAHNWTPLHFAAANGRQEIVKTILAVTKVGIDSVDKQGFTPLMIAAGVCQDMDDGNLEVLKLLVSNGASRILRNPLDKNAKGICTDQDSPQCQCDILSPSAQVKPTRGGNCSTAIHKLYGDDGTLPAAKQAFSTFLPIPLSSDLILDPNLTPRYSHPCGRILKNSPCFHVDIFLAGKYIGQGSIIDEDFVSTAASIFPSSSQLSPNEAGLTVKLTTRSKKSYGVAQVFRHVNYNGGILSDTVLLHLAENIDFQLEEACPICLPYESFDSQCFGEMSCFVIGSKLGNTNQQASGPWLFYEAPPAVNVSYCQGIWNNNRPFPDATHCVENRDDWCTSPSSSFICVHKNIARLFGHQTLPRESAHVRACPRYNAQTVISLITSETTRTFYRTTLQSIRQRSPSETRVQTAQNILGVCDRLVDELLEVNITSCQKNSNVSNVDTHTFVQEEPGTRLQVNQEVDKACIGSNGKLLQGTEVTYRCTKTYYKLEGSEAQTCAPSGKWTGPPPFCKLICGKVYGTVFNGVKAKEKEMPWAVALLNERAQPLQDPNKKALPRISCGGSLVGTKWVLTAAHCLQQHVSRVALYQPEDVKVFIGLRNNYDVGEIARSTVREVSKIIAHEAFSPWELQNDVALLQLSSHVTLDNYVQVICLPPPDFPVRDYELVKVAAWGSQGRPDEDGHQDLMVGEVALEECYDGKLLCTGHYADFPNRTLASLCRGDSGSPIMVEEIEDGGQVFYLVGIVSGKASRTSCDDLASGVKDDKREVRIMKVPNYVNWIEKKMNENP